MLTFNRTINGTLNRTVAALSLATTCCLAFSTAALAGVTFYENDNYQGRSFTTERRVGNFLNVGFNDRASSIVVTGSRWEVCEDLRFEGRCRVLRQGSYPSLRAMGMNDRISSVRPVGVSARVDEERYGPAAPEPSAWRRRGGERLFEAPVSEVRVVMGRAGQRCWVERQEVLVDNRPQGDGRPRVLGARTSPDGRTLEWRDVQRCEAANGPGDVLHWDVRYRFRGQLHDVQLTRPPGATVTVNGRGEPRE